MSSQNTAKTESQEEVYAHESKAYKKAQRKAKNIVGDQKQVETTVGKAEKYIYKHKGKLDKVIDDLDTFIRLLRAWISGKYKDVPVTTIILIIAAIIYVLNPFDLIPDFIPGVGFIDDALVIALVLRSTLNDIEKFREWERT